MQTFPLNALAESFEVDRSTMLRAMRDTPPDEVKKGNRPAWKTSTAAKALERHHRRKNESGSNGRSSYPGLPQLVDQIEADFEAFEAGFAQLEAEPDLERRRKLDKKLGVGKLIGGLDRRMKEASAAIGEERSMSALVGDHLLGDLINRYLTICDYWPDDAELDKLRAEGKTWRELVRE
jgi:hypothetical protein